MKHIMFAVSCAIVAAGLLTIAMNASFAQGPTEDAIVHSGEKLNPAYLEKRRELDALKKQKADVEALQKLDGSKAGWEYLNHLISRINKVEYELSRLPMYPPKSEPSSEVPASRNSPSRQETPTESRPPLVEDRTTPIPVAGKCELTIAYHSYIPAEDLLPEPVERAGGIGEYIWIIYPKAYFDAIEKSKADAAKWEKRGISVSVLGGKPYELQGTDDDKREILKALEEARPVVCGMSGPAAVTITIPAGRYYLDYWIYLRGTTPWGNTNRLGPRSVRRQDGKDWGPCELTVKANSETQVNVTPYGDNTEFKMIGLGHKGVLNLITYGDRLGP